MDRSGRRSGALLDMWTNNQFPGTAQKVNWNRATS